MLTVRIARRMRVSIDKCNSLNVITYMMIVFVSAHYQVLFGFFEAQVPNRLGPVPSDVDVGEVLARLAVRLLLLRQTWEL